MNISLLSLLILITGAHCNGNDNGSFLNPPDGVSNDPYITNPVWALGGKQTLKWTTLLTTYNISLWQQSMTQNVATQGASPVFSWSNGNGKGPGSYDWIVQPSAYGFDITVSPVFFFYVGPGSSVNTPGFTSRYFNISSFISPASSLSSSTATSTSTSSPGPSSNTTIPGSAVPGSSSQTSSSSSSAAMKVGLGVGVGIGIPLVLILGIVAGMKIVQTRRSGSLNADMAHYSDPAYHDNKPVHQFAQQELPTHQSPTRQRAELYGSG